MWSEDRSSFRGSEALSFERHPVLARHKYPSSSELSEWGTMAVSGGHEIVYRIGLARIQDENAQLLYVMFAGVIDDEMTTRDKIKVRTELEEVLARHSGDIARKAGCSVVSTVRSIPKTMYGSLADYLMGIAPSSF